MIQGIVDIGNTDTKFGVFKANKMLEVGLKSDLKYLAEYLNNSCQKIFIGNTAQQEKKELLLSLLPKSKLVEIKNYQNLPVNLGNYPSHSLGADRLANAMQALKIYSNKPVLVIDCGTCITYDAINNSQFFGFGISPGLKTRLQSMHFATATLPILNFKANDFVKTSFFKPNSSEQMLDSVMLGVLSEIEARIDFCSKQFNACNVVLTGGDAESLKKHLKISTFADPYWTLKGYNEILLNNI